MSSELLRLPIFPFSAPSERIETIDYTTERFEDAVRGVDVVLDTVGGDTLERSWRVVRYGEMIVTTAEEPEDFDAGEISEERATAYGVRGVSFIVKPRPTAAHHDFKN